MTKINDLWLRKADTQRVMGVFSAAGHQIFAVGGCVRNALLGVPVVDIDLATSATPEQIMALAKSAGLKAIPTGIDHGTITVVSGQTPYEITTFRRDTETDGRHAVVAFTNSIQDDARRRDFTMNALYADANGTVHDPLNGLDDLRARRVRFIEDADARIKEDYLRSLRFFRFHAQYGDSDQGVDGDALAAIAANLEGLDTLAAERIGAEIMKLLAAPDPAPALAAMQSTNALGRVLPGADPRYMAPLVHLETSAGIGPDPIRRLALIGGQDPNDRLRLSRKDAKKLQVLANHLSEMTSTAEIAWRHGPDVAWSVVLLRQTLLESPLPKDVAHSIRRASKADCPIAAKDLLWQREGPALGAALRRAESAWIKSDFTLDRAAMIAIALKEG